MTGGPAQIGVRRVWPMALLAVTLCACAGLGDDKKPEENIFPTEYKTRIRERLDLQISDPRSIRDAYIAEPALKPRGAITRYIACVRFDAKDEHGQYMGNKEYAAFFYQGQLTQVTDATREMCDGALYRPFPELEKH
jgi:hypothetical protein